MSHRAHFKKSQEASPVAPSPQLWFFLYESMTASSYKQGVKTFTEIDKLHMTLENCLKWSGSYGKVSNHAFYIHSESMSSAVQLLSDESIVATYNLYCTADPIITVIIRHANDPSPNSSRAPSHESSLASRRTLSSQRGISVRELFIQPSIRHASRSTDIETMEPIEDENKAVSITQGDTILTFTQDYLLGWIESQVTDLKQLTDISVTSITEDGNMQEIKLTPDVWQRCLLRGPWKDQFSKIWEISTIAHAKREEELSRLASKQSDFYQQCSNFIHDLRNFGQSKGAQARLESNGHRFYIGRPYFDDNTRDAILALPHHYGTLETALNALEQKRSGSTIYNFMKYSHDGGVTWSNWVAVSGGDPLSRDCMVGVAPIDNNVNLIAVFENTEEGRFTVDYVIPHDDGYSWSESGRLYTPRNGRIAGAPQVYNVWGTLVASFMTDEDIDGTNGYDGGQMKVITSTDGARSWSGSMVNGEKALHWPGLFNRDPNHFLALHSKDGLGAVSQLYELQG